MELIKKSKNICSLKDYVHITEYASKYNKLSKIQFNMPTILVLKKIQSYEIQYFMEHNKNGLACVLFELLLGVPVKKTWKDLGQEMVIILQFWLNELRKQISNNEYWWTFMLRILLFIKELRAKHSSLPNILVEHLTDPLLDLATQQAADAWKKYEILHCLNMYCSESSKEIRFALRKKFEGYFMKLASDMATCGHVPCQFGILETLLRWLIPRDEKVLRSVSAKKWFTQPLYDEEIVGIFLHKPWLSFFEDARDLLNAHNGRRNEIVSVVCKKFMAGEFIIRANKHVLNLWLDVNSSTKCITILLDPSILKTIDETKKSQAEVLAIRDGNTDSVVLKRESAKTILRIKTKFPIRLEPSRKVISEQRDVTIFLSSKSDLKRLDTALKRIFGDKYSLNVDLNTKIKSSLDVATTSQVPLQAKCAVKFSQLSKRRHLGVISIKKSSTYNYKSPSSVSTGSLTRLHDQLEALPRLQIDASLRKVLAQPELSSVQELSETSSLRSIKTKACGIISFKRNKNTVNVTNSSVETKIITVDKSVSKELVIAESQSEPSDVSNTPAIETISYVTVRKTRNNIPNDNFENLDTIKTGSVDEVGKCLDNLIQQVSETCNTACIVTADYTSKDAKYEAVRNSKNTRKSNLSSKNMNMKDEEHKTLYRPSNAEKQPIINNYITVTGPVHMYDTYINSNPTYCCRRQHKLYSPKTNELAENRTVALPETDEDDLEIQNEANKSRSKLFYNEESRKTISKKRRSIKTTSPRSNERDSIFNRLKETERHVEANAVIINKNDCHASVNLSSDSADENFDHNKFNMHSIQTSVTKKKSINLSTKKVNKLSKWNNTNNLVDERMRDATREVLNTSIELREDASVAPEEDFVLDKPLEMDIVNDIEVSDTHTIPQKKKRKRKNTPSQERSNSPTIKEMQTNDRESCLPELVIEAVPANRHVKDLSIDNIQRVIDDNLNDRNVRNTVPLTVNIEKIAMKSFVFDKAEPFEAEKLVKVGTTRNSRKTTNRTNACDLNVVLANKVISESEVQCDSTSNLPITPSTSYSKTEKIEARDVAINNECVSDIYDLPIFENGDQPTKASKSKRKRAKPTKAKKAGKNRKPSPKPAEFNVNTEPLNVNEKIRSETEHTVYELDSACRKEENDDLYTNRLKSRNTQRSIISPIRGLSSNVSKTATDDDGPFKNIFPKNMEKRSDNAESASVHSRNTPSPIVNTSVSGMNPLNCESVIENANASVFSVTESRRSSVRSNGGHDTVVHQPELTALLKLYSRYIQRRVENPNEEETDSTFRRIIDEVLTALDSQKQMDRQMMVKFSFSLGQLTETITQVCAEIENIRKQIVDETEKESSIDSLINVINTIRRRFVHASKEEKEMLARALQDNILELMKFLDA